MYLDINFDQCVLPAHVKCRLNKILDLGGKLPSMIFCGPCLNEIESVSYAIAKRADLLPIKITPKLVPKLKRHTQSESFVRQLDELLNTITVDSLQKRLVVINDLSGLAKKDHAYLAKVIGGATKGTVLFHAYTDTAVPKLVRQTIPLINFDFSLNHRADTRHDISQQCMRLLDSMGRSVAENDIQREIESTYPIWTKLADETMLKEFRTTNFKRIRTSKRKPKLVSSNNYSGEYLTHSFDKYYPANAN